MIGRACRLLMLAALLPAALFLATPATPAAAASLAISPSQGHRGDAVTVTGSGFPNGTVTVLWQGVKWISTSTQGGSFKASSTVPAYAQIGSNTITAQGRSGAPATTTFTVLAPPAPSPVGAPTPSPRASPSPLPASPSPAAASPSPAVSPSPAGLPLTLTLRLTWAGGEGQSVLGPVTCTAQSRTCTASGSIPADHCGGQECAASATCTFADTQHGSCAIKLSPCGTRSSCTVTGAFTCSNGRCEGAFAFSLQKAATSQFPWWLLIAALLALLLAVPWAIRLLRQRSLLFAPARLAAAGPTPTPAAEVAATELEPPLPELATGPCRCQDLSVHRDERMPPFTCEAQVTGQAWKSPGVIFHPVLEVLVGTTGGPGTLAGTVELSELKAEIDDSQFPDLGYGLSLPEWRAIDRSLQADLLGEATLTFEGRCRQQGFCTSRVEFDISVRFSPALEQLIQRPETRRGVDIAVAFVAAVSIGDCRASERHTMYSYLYLDRATGKVDALTWEQRNRRYREDHPDAP